MSQGLSSLDPEISSVRQEPEDTLGSKKQSFEHRKLAKTKNLD